MSPSRDPLPGAGRFPGWIAIGVVAAVALGASLAGLHNEFAQDDLVIIAQNARVHSLGNWRELLTSPYWPPPYTPDLYRPLTSLLLAMEYALGRGSPLLFRITSYLLYAAAAVGVLALARRLLPLGIAVGVALLFAAHPVHVEAVALGVNQNELVVGICAALLTCRYLDRRRSGSGELSKGDWALLASGYLAASLLKEHGLVLLGLLLAAELLLVSGPLRPRLRRLWAGYGLLAGVAAAVLLVRSALFPGHLAGSYVADALQGQGIGGRALTMLQVILHWGRLLLWPAHLQADYSPQELVASHAVGATEALGLAVLVAGAATVWLVRRRAPVLAFGLVWMGCALLPVSNVLVPTGILLAERTLFLPSIGFVLALGGLVVALRSRFGLASREWRVGFGVVVAALVVAGGARSARRHQVWRDDAAYAIRTAVDAPRSWRAQKAAGSAHFAAREIEASLDAYDRALQLAPRADVWQVRNDLARRLFEAGEDSLAVDQLRSSLRASPDRVETRHYLVLGLLALGRYRAAAAEADSAVTRGGPAELFGGLRSLADSAARAHAPPGSIRVRVVSGAGVGATQP
jgi:protein O-mannosyl-transferase